MMPGCGGGSADPFEILLVCVALAVLALVVDGEDQFVSGEFFDTVRVGFVVVIDDRNCFSLDRIGEIVFRYVCLAFVSFEVLPLSRTIGVEFVGRDVAVGLAVFLVPFIILSVVDFDKFPFADQLGQVYVVVVVRTAAPCEGGGAE